MSDETITPAPNIVTWPTDDEAQQAFEEYCVAVGKVCHAWNYFHEKLGQLFARFSPADTDGDVAVPAIKDPATLLEMRQAAG
jgi:hypothetical protein